MCYRKSVPGIEALEKKFKLHFTGEPFKRKYQVSAFSEEKLPVITNEEPRQIKLFQWGLVPF